MSKNTIGYLVSLALVTLTLAALAATGTHYTEDYAQAKVNDNGQLYYLNAHHELSAPNNCYFDRESVAIGGRDLRWISWKDQHTLEVFHYGTKSVVFDGVNFTNNTGRRAVILAIVTCFHHA